MLLQDLAPALYATGLRHLNLSLDTLRRDRYWKITGRDNLPQVLAGLDQATALGFHPLKINCVVMRGINEDEILHLALLARDRPIQVRFIELMPTVSRTFWQRHFLPLTEVRRHLSELGLADPVSREATAGPALLFQFPGFKGGLGFISPRSEHHCRTCNRLRLTAAGQLRPCLADGLELDLKGPLRQGLSNQLLAGLFKEAIRLKDCGFGFPSLSGTLPAMASIGG